MNFEIFLKAAELMLPDLTIDNHQMLELAEYAKMQYEMKPGVPICVLCAIDRAQTKSFRRFYDFCQKLKVDTGTREVIISDGKIFFTEDFKNWPVEVDWQPKSAFDAELA